MTSVEICASRRASRMAMAAPLQSSGGGGDGVTVAGKAVAEEFRVDPGAAFLGMLVLFEDDDAAPLGHDEAVTVLVPRAAGPRRVVVAGREGAGGAEAGHAKLAQGGLGAAGDHDVGLVVLDEPHGVADRVRPGGA